MLEDIVRERQKKLDAIREAGIDPYPARVERSFMIGKAIEEFDRLAETQKVVSFAGRLRSMRDQGKIVFADIEDESGKIQIVMKEDTLPELEFWRGVLDVGDFVSVTGILFITKRGERSLEVQKFAMVAKTLMPLPDEWFGLEDIESRLRERYVDLIMNREVREMFVKKSTFWQSTRQFLLAKGFLEVETPVLEAIAGGAEAEPFVTHHNALDTDFYLRISPELNLKRLLVGGFEKVFEIGRIFRNEGIDAEHLQDYTQMEMYWAYQDYEGLMDAVESLIKHVIKETFGTFVIARKGQEVDWEKPWVRYDYSELFKKYNDMDLATATKDELFAKAKAIGIMQAEPSLGRGRLIDLIYKKTVRPTLVEPGFLVNPPVDIEPLAKRLPGDPTRVERFQVVAYGTELGKGFSELNDPVDQRGRFTEQSKLREAGDAEAQMFDADYVKALEYGMPPAAGFAYSERLFSVLVDKPVRETVFFPLMRPKDAGAGK